MTTPDFDEAKWRERVKQLVAVGMTQDAAEDEAWIEQHPDGDVIVVGMTPEAQHQATTDRARRVEAFAMRAVNLRAAIDASRERTAGLEVRLASIRRPSSSRGAALTRLMQVVRRPVRQPPVHR